MKWRVILGSKCGFPLFLFLFFTAGCQNLDKKLHLVEQRVLNETVFGRQMRDYMRNQNTRYILNQKLPAQARYSLADESIHYNPKLDAPLKQWKKELLLGRPIHTILRFHEELHRSQARFSKQGAFFLFFRENGSIKEQLLPSGRMSQEFEVAEGKEEKILKFASDLAGYPVLNLQTASEIVQQKIDEMNRQNKEPLLLQEIHAYLASDIALAEAIYKQLYKTPKATYENLPEMDFPSFSRLCDLVVNLYGFYQGNHEKVCQIIGSSESILDFHQRAESILNGISEQEVRQRVNTWMEMKKEWAKETIRIAREIL